MEMREIGNYVQIGGIVVGAIAALVLVQQHPIHIILLGVGAAMYFAGQFMKK